MGSHDPFKHFKHKLWPKKKLWVKGCESKIASISSHAGGVRHTIGKILNEGYNFALNLISIGGLHVKLWTSKVVGVQVVRIWDSHLGVPRQNDIWVLVSWPGIEYTIRGKVVASSKFGPWWVLWVWICLWLILTPKVFELCINQLVWFCAGLCEWVIVCHFS